EKPQLDVKFSNGTMGDMKDACVWVHDEEKLKQLVEVLSNERVFAVDTEQHSLHLFLGFTALIQVGHIGVNDLRHYTRRNASASTSRTLYDESDEDIVDEDDIVDLGNDGEIRNENLDDYSE
ncbi:RRP6-like protein 3 isoform X1, partial [Tanacetum coccineum]